MAKQGVRLVLSAQLELRAKKLAKYNEHHDSEGRFAPTDGVKATKEKPKKKMKEKVYSWTGKVSLKDLKGHQLLVATALQKVGTGTLSQIVAKVKEGAPYVSTHDIEVSVRGNLAIGASKHGWAQVEKDVDPATLTVKDTVTTTSLTAETKSETLSLPAERTVNSDEYHDLMNYKGSGYQMINGFLRNNPEPAVKNGTTATRIKNIDRLMAASVTTKDTIVYRGVKAESIENRIKSQDGKLTLTDHGYVSTAASPDGLMTAMGGLGVKGWAVMEIHVPAGTPVVDVEGLRYKWGSGKGTPKVGPFDPSKIHTSKFSEQELLLPHGSTFKISGSETRQFGYSSRKVYKVTLVKHSALWKLLFAQMLGLPKEPGDNRFLWEDGDVVIHPPDDEEVEKIDEDDLEKMNPYHDKEGRFANADEVFNNNETYMKAFLVSYGYPIDEEKLGVIATEDKNKVFEYPIEKVPLDQMVATQRTVSKEKVAEYVAKGPENLSTNSATPVLVAKIGDKYYIQDGHHRAAAASRLDMTHLDARVARPTDEEIAAGRKLYLEKIEKLLRKIEVDWSDEEDDLVDMLMEEYGVGYGEAMAVLGKYDELGGVDEAAAIWAQEHAATLVTEIEDSTVERLQNMISRAIEEGKTPAELTDDIEASGLFDADRAELIAFNEVAMAQGAGALESWKSSGLVSGKRAILGSEHDLDDICDENVDAGTIPLDEDFPSGDSTSPFHPNCRCDVVASVEPVTQD